jgi:hypothetical protein
MDVHRAMRKADLDDANDGYFWLDPYSAQGALVAGKLRPILGEIRQHAERAVTLVAEARAAAKAEQRELANSEALDALELGARRIDAMAMKFQFADDAVNLYARAQALARDKKSWDEVEALLETIGDNNGRFQDIRDSYTELGALYSQAWLRDNRPYWLGNNQARYEKAAELWIGRGDRWNLVMNHWWSTHTLLPAGEVGLPAVK